MLLLQLSPIWYGRSEKKITGRIASDSIISYDIVGIQRGE